MWTDCLQVDSQRKVCSIFKGEIPDLSDIILLSIEWRPDWVVMVFELCKLPKVIPEKWRVNGIKNICVSMDFSENIQYRFMNLNLLRNEHFSLSIGMDSTGKKSVIGKCASGECVFVFCADYINILDVWARNNDLQ
jgi:hypothetical protein